MGLQAKGISTRMPQGATRMPERGFLVPLMEREQPSSGGSVGRGPLPTIGGDGEINPLPLPTDLGGVVGEWLEERGLCLFLLIGVVEEGRGLCLFLSKQRDPLVQVVVQLGLEHDHVVMTDPPPAHFPGH